MSAALNNAVRVHSAVLKLIQAETSCSLNSNPNMHPEKYWNLTVTVELADTVMVATKLTQGQYLFKA